MNKIFAMLGAAALMMSATVYAAENPCAMKGNPCAMKANPCAAKNPCDMKQHKEQVNKNTKKKAANPCAANPCAAKNPCATKNPCAAKKSDSSSY